MCCTINHIEAFFGIELTVTSPLAQHKILFIAKYSEDTLYKQTKYQKICPKKTPKLSYMRNAHVQHDNYTVRKYIQKRRKRKYRKQILE